MARCACLTAAPPPPLLPCLAQTCHLSPSTSNQTTIPSRRAAAESSSSRKHTRRCSTCRESRSSRYIPRPWPHAESTHAPRSASSETQSTRAPWRGVLLRQRRESPCALLTPGPPTKGQVQYSGPRTMRRPLRRRQRRRQQQIQRLHKQRARAARPRLRRSTEAEGSPSADRESGRASLSGSNRARERSWSSRTSLAPSPRSDVVFPHRHRATRSGSAGPLRVLEEVRQLVHLGVRRAHALEHELSEQ